MRQQRKSLWWQQQELVQVRVLVLLLPLEQVLVLVQP